MQILTLILLSVFLIGLAEAEIFRWMDENGKVHFSDKPPKTHSAESIKLKINTYTAVSYDTSNVDVGKKVIMYSAKWCGVCKKASTYFKQKGIKYTEYDIDRSSIGKSQFKKLGGKGVPIILVGKHRMNGFSVAGFEKLYQ